MFRRAPAKEWAAGKEQIIALWGHTRGAGETRVLKGREKEAV